MEEISSDLYIFAVPETVPYVLVKRFQTLLVSPLKAFTAPISILSEIFSRCPRKRSHGPAIEIWSVVHLPCALISNGILSKSVPSQAGNGCSNWSRCEWGFTLISTFSLLGAIYPSLPSANPFGGNSSPTGSESFTFSPSRFTNTSVSGLKQRSPAIVSAIVNSGEATKAYVFGLPSARLAKLRLKEVTIEFLRVGLSVSRFHWPIQGPQAFAIIVAPTFSKVPIIPSRSAVARIRSEPGFTIRGAATFRCFSSTWRARETARLKSW